MAYWDYYDPNFDWNDVRELSKPDIAHSRCRFASLGLSDNECDELLRSGYSVLRNDVVIDRFYGGHILSTDGRTRFPLERLKNVIGAGSPRLKPTSVSSLTELKNVVDRLRSQYNSLLFRGQTNSYAIARSKKNSFFTTDKDEISLLPSLWREQWRRSPLSYLSFTSLTLFEWSSIIYAGFDQNEIARRVEAINAAGGWIHSAQDMEDSDDPLLQRFGKARLDLMMGADFNLADSLGTLLQHYGLYSPLLDLTSDIEVALFFATHKFRRGSANCSYDFIGTNHRNAVLYVFRQDRNEMQQHEHQRVLDLVKPLRPDRQSCVVCRSGPFALNLAAEFLVAAITLDFDISAAMKTAVAHLFPGPSEDSFLAAMCVKLEKPELIVKFQQ